MFLNVFNWLWGEDSVKDIIVFYFSDEFKQSMYVIHEISHYVYLPLGSIKEIYVSAVVYNSVNKTTVEIATT